jgi:catechol 2,3-dioxygenase-like lactoylglutathione lyase family enzyme
MKRMHVMLKVTDLQESIAFYTALFGAAPTTQKDDYAKWFIDDPRVNFSIAEQAGPSGIEHLGIQAEDETELRQLYASADQAEASLLEEGHTTCCYARSEKAWVKDPQGVDWELFHTYGESATYHGEDVAAACCDDGCCVEEAV